VIYAIIVLYISSNVIANLVVNSFGQAALVWTAFVLIPFDLASRDALHERWSGDRLALRMFALVAIGAVITFAINASALRIAIASSVAFTLSAIVDTAVYHSLRKRTLMIKMNASNICGAIADSIAFPLIAFGEIIWTLSAQQAGLKILGGAAWSLALARLLYMK